MYQANFHGTDISSTKFLITGGAGFIGSNLVEYLVHHKAGFVRILDNLSEGKIENIEPFLQFENVEFVEGDIDDQMTCEAACQNIDFVSHQAALGSVPRSIATPTITNNANVTGFLNMLTAAKDAGVKRFVYASSSSVYMSTNFIAVCLETVTILKLSDCGTSMSLARDKNRTAPTPQ